MTAEQERNLLTEYLANCRRLHIGFEATASRVATIMPIGPERIDTLDTDDETLVLAYLKRFEQFEDALHRTLKAISKIMEYGKIERLTARDVTHRAHALGILPDDKIWADAVRTRNALAHEYPLDPVKRADQLAQGWASRETLNTTWAAIQRFVAEEGLLND